MKVRPARMDGATLYVSADIATLRAVKGFVPELTARVSEFLRRQVTIHAQVAKPGAQVKPAAPAAQPAAPAAPAPQAPQPPVQQTPRTPLSRRLWLMVRAAVRMRGVATVSR